MPCSQCNGVGHNVRTCPSIEQHRRRIRDQAFAPQTPPDSPPNVIRATPRQLSEERMHGLLRQGLPMPEPGPVQHESVSRIVPPGPLRMRQQLPYPGFNEERIRLQQESRRADLIIENRMTADNTIDHSLNQMIRWGRRLTREIENRRELDIVETQQHIKLKMIDNMDDHFNTENCPVCLDSYSGSKKNCVAIECRHIVCSDCMIEIIKRKKYDCPCCRAPFQELRVLPGINPETFNSLSDIL